jgi:hypothetical protein
MSVDSVSAVEVVLGLGLGGSMWRRAPHMRMGDRVRMQVYESHAGCICILWWVVVGGRVGAGRYRARREFNVSLRIYLQTEKKRTSTLKSTPTRRGGVGSICGGRACNKLRIVSGARKSLVV